MCVLVSASHVCVCVGVHDMSFRHHSHSCPQRIHLPCCVTPLRAHHPLQRWRSGSCPRPIFSSPSSSHSYFLFQNSNHVAARPSPGAGATSSSSCHLVTMSHSLILLLCGAHGCRTCRLSSSRRCDGLKHGENQSSPARHDSILIQRSRPEFGAVQFF